MPSGLGLSTIREAIEVEALEPSNFTLNSLACMTIAQAGACASKTVQLNPGAGATTENLFSVSGGPVRLHEIYLVATAVGDSTTFSNVKFEFDDGGAQVDITDVVDASGIVVGGVVDRANTSGNPAVFTNASAAVVQDPPSVGNRTPLVACLLVPKTSTTCYVRLSYTADGATDVTIYAMARWSPMINEATLAAV